MDHRFFYFGTNLANGIRHFTGGDSDAFLWRSIYCLTQVGNPERNAFLNALKTSQADFAIIDLYSLMLPVDIKEDGTLVPASEGMPKKTYYKDLAMTQKAVDTLAKDLLSRFEGSHILLIRSKKSKKVATDEWVVNSNVMDNDITDYLFPMEERFFQATQAALIDLCGYYFADADYVFGKSLLNYEKSFYVDAIRKIQKHVQSPAPLSYYGTPSFDLLLDRYVKYADCLYKKFAIASLLSLDKPLEKFISLASPRLVKEYKKQLLAVYLASTSPEDTFEKLSQIDDFFENILDWYAYCSKKGRLPSHFDERIHEYGLKLEKSIVGRFSDLAMSNDYYLTTTNYVDYLQSYFFDQKGRPFENALLLDVWGSCISRQVFTELEGIANVTLKHYLYRNSPLYAFDEPIHVDPALYTDLSLFNNSTWRANIFKYATTREYADIIRYSESSWIIVDLYDLVERFLTIEGKRMVCDYDFTTFPIFEKLGKTTGMAFSYWDESVAPIDDDFRQRITKFCDLLQEKYENRIILVNVLFKNLYVTCHGEVKPLHEEDAVLESKNAYLGKAMEMVKEILGDNAYLIDVCSSYLPDEKFVWGESPVHYEDGFFKDVASLIRDILKNKPNQKVYRNEPSLETIKERKQHCEKHKQSFDNDLFKLFSLSRK